MFRDPFKEALGMGMIDLRIQIIAHNGSTPSHFFFYDFIYLKCLQVSAEKVPRGPNETALKVFN